MPTTDPLAQALASLPASALRQRRRNPWDAKQAYADALMKQGASTAPVGSVWEGVARAGQGLAGGLFGNWYERQEKGEQEKQNSALAEALASGDTGKIAKVAAQFPDLQDVAVRMRIAEIIDQRQRAATRSEWDATRGGTPGGMPAGGPSGAAPVLTGDPTLDRVAFVESGGRNVPNGMGSGATGPFQFMPETWKGLVKKYPQAGLTEQGINDPAQQAVAAKLFKGEIEQTFGGPVPPGVLYTAWFLGPEGAKKVVSMPPGTPLDQALTSIYGRDFVAKMYQQNPMIQGMRTTGDLMAAMNGRMGGDGGAPPAGAPPVTSASLPDVSRETNPVQLPPPPAPAVARAAPGLSLNPISAAQAAPPGVPPAPPTAPPAQIPMGSGPVPAGAIPYQPGTPSGAPLMAAPPQPSPEALQGAGAGRTGGIPIGEVLGRFPQAMPSSGPPAQPQGPSAAGPVPAPVVPVQATPAADIPPFVPRPNIYRDEAARLMATAERLRDRPEGLTYLKQAQDMARKAAEFDSAEALRRQEYEFKSNAERRAQANADRQAKQGDKLTESQGKDYTYALRLAKAIPALESMAASPDKMPGMVERQMTGLPLIGNTLASQRAQSFDQLQRDVINAILRRESGATITDAEFKNARMQYIPQPGDTPETVKMKMANLRTALQGIALSSGRGEEFGFQQGRGPAGANAPAAPQGGAPPPPPGFERVR